jgi:hypothetical protein
LATRLDHIHNLIYSLPFNLSLKIVHIFSMDTFSEPYTRLGDDISLSEVRTQVRALEEEHRAKGITLSGRIIHVCHYLPVTATLANRSGVLSPPPTPPTKSNEVFLTKIEPEPSPAVQQEEHSTWTLSPRYGHAAMISGIRSLSATHEQLLVGWTGDIQSNAQREHIPSELVSESDRAALEDALGTYHPREADPDDDKKTIYVPVWLDDKIAHGHYDSYCKQSEFLPIICSRHFFRIPVSYGFVPSMQFLFFHDCGRHSCARQTHVGIYFHFPKRTQIKTHVLRASAMGHSLFMGFLDKTFPAGSAHSEPLFCAHLPISAFRNIFAHHVITANALIHNLIFITR